ncbi:MAG TPA: hypothetical protein VFV67_34600 [Actinophytocola sp.]|uniref:hypothetical protein n=1 Tax=Actinophytocola sp. TaxID=1872138 RepID=UPI002DBF37CE|nr:hypothetical protein [Actinophytocola sp.]HEU5475796.1 hypothetical protein [Actinophytocola sp.]
MAGRVPRSLIAAVLLAMLVAAGAVAAAGVLRYRAAEAAARAATSEKAAPNEIDARGCLAEPCQVLAFTTVGGTSVELVADNGARSGRLRVGGVNGQVIPATVTDHDVLLTQDSLQCVSGGWSACLIRGRDKDDRVFGQLIVGRSGNWASRQLFVSDAGYLALAEVAGNSSPEVLAAQYVCGDEPCTDKPVRVRVFDLQGNATLCTTRNYPSLDKLPGYPAVQLNQPALGKCP